MGLGQNQRLWLPIYSYTLKFSILADVDYEPLSATVLFLASSGLNPVECQNVTLLDDDSEEDDETFQVQLSSDDCFFAQTDATVTIVDDGTYTTENFLVHKFIS